MKTSIDTKSPLTLLGQRSAEAFMHHYWQRKPLLIRQAMPDVNLPFDLETIHALSQKENVDSLLLKQEKNEWTFTEGPILQLPSRQVKDWTFFLNHIDLYDETIAKLARQFRFIPDTRFDEVVFAHSTKGACIGPHLECCGMFLLQVQGQRKWRTNQASEYDYLAKQDGVTEKAYVGELTENEESLAKEFILNPGDMLYLTADLRFEDIALDDDCVTLAFSFKPLSLTELRRGLLEVAADQISARAGLDTGLYGEPLIGNNSNEDNGLEQCYEDPMYVDQDQAASSHPAAIPEHMIQVALESTRKIQFNESLAARFIGCWLSEPHSSAIFPMPEVELDWEDFTPEAKFILDLQSRILYYGNELYINGEAIIISHELLHELANERQLHVKKVLDAPEEIQDMLLQWIDDGWLHYYE